MCHEDGVDMVDVIANQRAHHALIKPTVNERHGATLTNQNRIGLAHIEHRHRRRSESIPVDVRNRSQEHQARKPYRHRTCTGTRPPDQQSHQQTRHQVNPNAIGRHAHGCTRNGGKELLKEQCAPGGNHGYDECPSLQRRHKRKGNQHDRHSEQQTHHRTDDRIRQRSNERERTKGRNGDGQRRQLRAKRDGKHAGNARWHTQLSQSVGGVRAKAQDGKDAGT